MDNRKLGILLIIISSVILVTLGITGYYIYKAYQAEIDKYGESCPTDPSICPHEQRNRAMIPLYIASMLLIGMMALGGYLIFFEKSQKAIISTLEKHKQVQNEEERFNILMKGLSEDEQKIIKAVKEQDGITQQTLRLRVDMHKSKLSIVLGNLEKKDLIKRVDEGKTNKVYLKIAI